MLRPRPIPIVMFVLAVVFAMLASYLLSRTIVPTMAKYLFTNISFALHEQLLALSATAADDRNSVVHPSVVEPSQFRFLIHEITLKAAAVTVHDDFSVNGEFGPATIAGPEPGHAPYFVSVGRIDGSNVRDGQLVLDEKTTTNPYGPFIAKFVIPVDNYRRLALPIPVPEQTTLSVVVRSPQLRNKERLKIGFGDMETTAVVACVVLTRSAVLLQRSSRTAWDENILAAAGVPELVEAREVKLSITLSGAGDVSGSVETLVGNDRRVRDLVPTGDFATVPLTNRTLAAAVFVETLPRPSVFSVFPESITALELEHGGPNLSLKLVGVGFTPESQVEVFPHGAADAIKASAVHVSGAGNEIVAIFVRSNLKIGSYGLRVATGTDSVTIPTAIIVY